jgi:tetratricopeptide (TPR) repeat protein
VNLAAPRTVDPKQVLDQAIAALKVPGGELPLDDVDRALKVAPHDPRLWHVKGLIHRQLDHRELAIPALRRAVDLAPAEPLIAHGLARTLLEAGLPSVEEFGRAMKLNPNKPEVVKGMVAALAAEGRISDAIEGLETVLRKSPLWTEGHNLLAQLRWSNGERTDFTSSFDQALAMHANSLDLRRDQLILLMHADQWEETFDRIEAGRAAVGDNALFVAYEAHARSETGDIESADRLFAMLPTGAVADVDVRRVRHLLRAARAEQAVTLLDDWLETPEQLMFWHYADTAWRLTGDDRLDWLEEDGSFVGIYDLTDRLPPLEKLAGTLRQLHTAQAQPIAQSVRGGTQTDGNLFQRIEPEIVQLREAIRSAVEEHAAHLPAADPKHPLLGARPEAIRFTGAWSVRLLAGGHHSNHVHPHGWLSSAFYVVLPPDLGEAEAGWFTLGEPQAELGLDLAPVRLIEPRPGRLVLFPSYMWHGTRPFAKGERMTVAFDVARKA